MRKAIIAIISILILANMGFAQQTADIYFNRAIQKYLKGELDSAISEVEQAITLGATDKKVNAFLVKVLLERGGTLFSNKQYQDALPYFEKAKIYDPENKDIDSITKTIQDKLNPQTTIVTPSTQPFKTTIETTDAAASTLIKTLQSNQDKLIEKITQPNDLIRQILNKSDDERKELISMLDKKNDAVIDAVKSEKDTVKYLVVFFVIVIAVVVIFIYMTSVRTAHRRESVIMNQQEKILNIMLAQQTALAQGSTVLRLAQGSAETVPSSAEEFTTPKEMLSDANPRVRAKGIEIIDAQLVKEDENPDVAERILKPFFEDKDNRVRANAIKVLYRYKPELAIKNAKDMLQTDDKWMRVSAAWVLGELEGSKEAAETLLENLNVEDYHLRRRILKSLSKLNEYEKELPQDLKEKIKNTIVEIANKEHWII